MKPVLYYILFALSTLFCKSSFAQHSELISFQYYFDSTLNGWTSSFTNFSLSSFQHEKTDSFENIEYMDVREIRDFYSIYKPALTFSPDGNKFIDIYSYWLNLEKEGKKVVSYGGEADQAITLCNLKTKKWTRIAFRGTTERIQDLIWLTNWKFILVGVRADETSLGKSRPVIYIGDTYLKTLKCFVSKNTKIFQKSGGYDSPKLRKLKIVQK